VELTDAEAWIDLMPGKPHSIHVSGICICPTSGYSAELQRDARQGINTFDLILDLVVEAPKGEAEDVITPVPVDYREETDLRYKTVSIRPDGPSGIPVNETH
jgi:hypothetical protein